MPAGQGEDAERFAAAVEQGTPPGFAHDGEFARELAIVAMLRSSGPEFAPDPDAKARAKQRLMAIVAEQGEQRRGTAPRPVPRPTAQEMTAPIERVRESAFPTPRAEPGHPMAHPTARNAVTETEQLTPVRAAEPTEADDAPTTGPRTLSPSLPGRRGGRRSRHSLANRPAGRDGSSRRPAPSMRRRVALVTAAALVVMVALTGGGVMASRDALPGDSLYALKRATESAELALTFDEAARAQRHLQLAETRLSEVEQLVERTGQQVNPEVYTAAIKEFDTSTGEGSRLLLTAAEADRSAADLDTLTSWASQQSTRLTELLPALPAPAAADADGSLQLLDLLLGRAEALGASPGTLNRLGEDSSESEPNRTDSPSSGNSPEAEDGTTPPRTEGDEPSDAPSDSPEQDGGLIGGVEDLIDGDSQPQEGDNSEAGESEGEGASSSEPDAPPPSAGGGVEVPLPLLPPITLPSLLPGMPPITIG